MPVVSGIKNDHKFQDVNLRWGHKIAKGFFSCFDNFVEVLATDLNHFNGFKEKYLSAGLSRITISSKLKAGIKGNVTSF
jgi:hypothetical protein